MSLSSKLSITTRARVPDAVINTLLPGDKDVVENIITLACELFIHANISKTTVESNNDKYMIYVPLSDIGVSLRVMRDLESYSPSRIQDIEILRRVSGDFLKITIGNEKSDSVKYTEYDIIRLKKKVRWNAC